MQKTLTILAFLLAFPAGVALADDDCFVPMAEWQPREAADGFSCEVVLSVLLLNLDDVCYVLDWFVVVLLSIEA